MTVYLKLLHGRSDPSEQLEDWGFNGPVLGPFEAVHFTYTTHVRCFPEGSDGDAAAIELCYHDDLLVHDGKYYGDFEIATSFGAAPPQPALPPDPDNMNGKRAQWAEAALSEFKSLTGADDDTALYDLLTDLMHRCDRHALTFNDELDRARAHYDAETTPGDPQVTNDEESGNGSPKEAAAAPAPTLAPTPRPPIRKYRAEFFTPADYAVRDFEAATPEEALQLARDFYDEDGDLDFRSYDDNAGIERIQIWGGERGTLASWESDDCRLRKAAPELLKQSIRVLKILPHYGIYNEIGMSELRAAVFKAVGTEHDVSDAHGLKDALSQAKQGDIMHLKNRMRAVYSRTVHGSVIAIVDHNGPRSVANDAGNVIADLIAQGFDLSRYQVIYQDTRGTWDQLLVDRTGHFAGFSCLNARDLPAALAKLNRH